MLCFIKAGKGGVRAMPKYKVKRQGHLVIIKGFRIVHENKCERLDHEIRCNTDGHTYIQAMAHNKIVKEFMDNLNDKEYTPDGPTLYCVDCQEDCKYKGMEG